MMAANDEAVMLDMVVESLAAACQKDDIRTLRSMLRDLFGKELKELVMQSSAAGREHYTIDLPVLKESIGRTLAWTCCKYGSVQCLKVLLHRLPGVLDLSCVDEEGTPCLHLAIIGHCGEIVACLLQNGADINGRDKRLRSALHCAVVCHQQGVLSLLLAKKVAIDCQDIVGATPLHYGVQMCGSNEADHDVSLAVLQHLLCVKADVNCRDNKGRTPLHWAAGAGCADVCRMLVARGASADSVDNSGNGAMHMAARGGYADVLSMLVHDCHIDVNIKDASKQSPLALAVACCQLKCVESLLDIGAHDTVDDRGKSISHVAAAAGSLPIVEKLESVGYNFWRVTSRGELPIHFAVLAKHNDIVCHLLRHEKHGNPRGTIMKSCLHLAASSSNTDLLSRLLQMGGSINALIKNQGIYMTPLDVAEQRSLKESAAFISQYGGKPAKLLMGSSVLVIQRAMRRLVWHRKHTQLLQQSPFNELQVKDAGADTIEEPKQTDSETEADAYQLGAPANQNDESRVQAPAVQTESSPEADHKEADMHGMTGKSPENTMDFDIDPADAHLIKPFLELLYKRMQFLKDSSRK